MRDEVAKSRFTGFNLINHCDEDRDQFIGFVDQRLQQILGNIFSIHEHFKPVVTFVQFLDRAFHFADKV